ncbi:MAG: SH3 domain-containing protein [Thiotrichaceae bacterium]
MKPKNYFKSVLIAFFLVWGFLSTQSVLANSSYSVKGVGQSDVLNMRKYPGAKSKIIAKIPSSGQAIKVTGKEVYKGKSTWAQVHWKGNRGWVNKRFITRSGSANTSNLGKGKHIHPKNQCTNSITHTHASGSKSHVHRYSCKRAGNNATRNANSHTHPRNKCTRSITHSHANGKNTHKHRYSCKNNRKSNDANAHTHAKNKCTRSITHSHPNGKRTHKHRYSCKGNKTSNANAHTHPRKACTRSVTHTHPNGKRTHAHRYSCKN